MPDRKQKALVGDLDEDIAAEHRAMAPALEPQRRFPIVGDVRIAAFQSGIVDDRRRRLPLPLADEGAAHGGQRDVGRFQGLWDIHPLIRDANGLRARYDPAWRSAPQTNSFGKRLHGAGSVWRQTLFFNTCIELRILIRDHPSYAGSA